jgi:hypothetical protein
MRIQPNAISFVVCCATMGLGLYALENNSPLLASYLIVAAFAAVSFDYLWQD